MNQNIKILNQKIIRIKKENKEINKNINNEIKELNEFEEKKKQDIKVENDIKLEENKEIKSIENKDILYKIRR